MPGFADTGDLLGSSRQTLVGMADAPQTRTHPLWLAAGTGLVGVSLGAAAVLLGQRAEERRAPPAAIAVEPPAPGATEGASAVASVTDSGPSLVEAVARTRDAVVNLGTDTRLGSGVIVDPSGIIVTNHHVIADALQLPADVWPPPTDTPTVTARFEDGRQLDATVLVSDHVEDLAILRLKSSTPGERFSAVNLGRSAELAVGQDVFAIGNPFGLNHSVSRGIVAAVDRTDIRGNRSLPHIQLDASINVGNSGGPLFSLSGELMGIVTMRREDAEGIAFAVPVDHVRGFLAAVSDPQTPRRSSAIGVTVEARRENPESVGSGYAAWLEVTAVYDDGPAAAAGLRVGDRLVEVRGKRLDGLEDAARPEALSLHLVSAVRSLFPGEHLPLTVLREQGPVVLDVEVDAAPSDQQRVVDAQDLLKIRLEQGAAVPTIDRMVQTSSRAPDRRVEGQQIVQLLGKEIDSHESLGVQLAELRELARRAQSPLRVGLGLQDPKTGRRALYHVLVQ